MPKQKMSKAAYNAYLLGMFVTTLRSIIFNFLILFIGITIGMGFTIMHMQRAWKDRYSHDTVMKFEHALMKRGIIDKEMGHLLNELKEKQIDKNEKTEK